MTRREVGVGLRCDLVERAPGPVAVGPARPDALAGPLDPVPRGLDVGAEHLAVLDERASVDDDVGQVGRLGVVDDVADRVAHRRHGEPSARQNSRSALAPAAIRPRSGRPSAVGGVHGGGVEDVAAVDTSVRRDATLPAIAVHRSDSIIDWGAVSVPRHMVMPAAT